MNKQTTLIIVLCICIALGSFLGGVIYQYDNDRYLIESLQIKYNTLYEDIYTIPVNVEAVYNWLNVAEYYHQYYADNEEVIIGGMSTKKHQEYIEMYRKIRLMFLEINK